MVKATRRMVSAISFGVFCRFAPSTMRIMRSRNESPGLTPIRTTSQSESTRVPPVTAEKSPPDSRTTGADSPVMALSSTDATPSMTSPSSGIMSLASTSTMSPFRRRSACSGSHRVPCQVAGGRAASNFLAQVLFLRPRSDEAWALLLPSASASAKLPNNTVTHSQKATARTKPGSVCALPCSARSQTSVVRMLPM